jgi:hypothetical protein
MSIRRTVVLVLAVSALSARTVGAFLVTDLLLFAEHHVLNGWSDSIRQVLANQVTKMQDMARRLSVFTDLAKYVAPDTPLWRTRTLDHPLDATAAFLNAVNAGDARGDGFAAVSRARVAAADVLAALGEEAGNVDQALRTALATLDLADSAIIAGTDQTGRIRGSRRGEVSAIAALEQDVVDPDARQSTTAVLDKVSAAEVIRARQQQTRLQLLGALNEQLLVDAKRTRDADAAVMNMRLMALRDGRALSQRYIAGSADALRSWRQP